MMKKKVFDIAGSNIEMLGSAAETKCREAAAGTEKAWAKAGKKVGLEIWRIEKFKVKAWPKVDYGKFYIGDSYIVLNTYEKKDTEALAWDLHFWLGQETTQDEAGTAAYKTVELDDFLGGGPIQHREIGSKESSLFISYFKGGISLLEGGAESGFNHVEPENYSPRLLQLKGRKNVRVTQVELKASSLSAGDCFVLDNGLMLYQFQGKSCSLKEKTKAAQYCAGLDSERKGQAEIVVIDQEQKDSDYPSEFAELLGAADIPSLKAAIRPDDGGDEKWETSSDRRMFQLSDAGGKMEFASVGSGASVSLSKLDTDDVFIIDVGNEIFVWVGAGASAAEKKMAMSHAQQYIGDYKRPNYLPISRILEGSENATFIAQMTQKVKRGFKKSSGGPKFEQKGAMGCYLTKEESSNGSLFLNWSQTELKNYKAYMKPKKSVPRFKFNSKGGKSELTREINSKPKNQYQACCNFVKLAKKYEGSITWKDGDVSLFSLEGKKVVALPVGTEFSTESIVCIGAIASSKGTFKSVKTTDKGSFVNKCQTGGGAALSLS